MNENRRIALLAGGMLLALVGGGYLLLRTPPAELDVPVAVAPAVAPSADAAAPTDGEPLPAHHEMPESPADAAPLPPLAESDAPLLAALAERADGATLAESLVSEQLIRRLVATVDNLPRDRLGLNDRAFRRVPGSFLIKSRDGSTTTSPANEARYLPLLGLARSVGADTTARIYLRFYPLFDKAYRELGYPDRHFNDRLVQVIDHLLATPYVEGPIELVQPKVVYLFADPQLEALSAGQKMLIRMGSVNATQAKEWLKAFRAGIIKA